MRSLRYKPCEEMERAHIFTEIDIESASTFFDSKKSPALHSVAKFDLFRIWHPRFQFVKDFKVPAWLQGYMCVHFGSDSTCEEYTKAVHLLYHTSPDNFEDRKQMALALSIGETIAAVRCADTSCRDNKDVTAVAALTYAQIGSNAVIMFLAVDPKFRKAGTATHLFVLLGKTFLHRNRRTIQLFLSANEHQNPNAWNFYKRRGFVLYGNEVPGPVHAFFQERSATKICQRSTPSNGLSWLVVGTLAKRGFPQSKSY